jgi:gamma-glutamylcyclotransferase (GGCT)/AIG2-like uncharacterized protein YtfP
MSPGMDRRGDGFVGGDVSGDGVHAGMSADGARGNGREPEPFFHLFVYGTLRSDRSHSAILDGCECVTKAKVEGTLYQLDDHPALILYGSTPVHGEVWRCPADLLWRLDEYENIGSGLFRRVGLEVAGFGCWLYVAGHALAHRLTPDRRLATGDWTPAST